MSFKEVFSAQSTEDNLQSKPKGSKEVTALLTAIREQASLGDSHRNEVICTIEFNELTEGHFDVTISQHIRENVGKKISFVAQVHLERFLRRVGISRPGVIIQGLQFLDYQNQQLLRALGIENPRATLRKMHLPKMQAHVKITSPSGGK